MSNKKRKQVQSVPIVTDSPMTGGLRWSSKQFFTGWGALFAILVGLGVTFSVRAYFSSRPSNSPPAEKVTDFVVNTSLQEPTERLRVELVTLKRNGFEPQSITRPQGKFMLIVNNRSGKPVVDFYFERENGGRMHSMKVKRNKPEWLQEVVLGPGRYRLREESRADWICEFIITSQ